MRNRWSQKSSSGKSRKFTFSAEDARKVKLEGELWGPVGWTRPSLHVEINVATGGIEVRRSPLPIVGAPGWGSGERVTSICSDFHVSSDLRSLFSGVSQFVLFVLICSDFFSEHIRTNPFCWPLFRGPPSTHHPHKRPSSSRGIFEGMVCELSEPKKKAKYAPPPQFYSRFCASPGEGRCWQPTPLNLRGWTLTPLLCRSVFTTPPHIYYSGNYAVNPSRGRRSVTPRSWCPHRARRHSNSLCGSEF